MKGPTVKLANAKTAIANAIVVVIAVVKDAGEAISSNVAFVPKRSR
jgi:hypothetical protein